jgi:hypothetical protein
MQTSNDEYANQSTNLLGELEIGLFALEFFANFSAEHEECSHRSLGHTGVFILRLLIVTLLTIRVIRIVLFRLGLRVRLLLLAIVIAVLLAFVLALLLLVALLVFLFLLLAVRIVVGLRIRTEKKKIIFTQSGLQTKLSMNIKKSELVLALLGLLAFVRLAV